MVVFQKKIKKKKKVIAKSSEPKRKDPEELKREARPKLESWMRENKIWQIDLFDLITDKYEIYSPHEYKSDTEWVDEFLIDAKQCGVMGQQAITLSIFLGKKKKIKKKKKQQISNQPKKPKQKSLKYKFLYFIIFIIFYNFYILALKIQKRYIINRS